MRGGADDSVTRYCVLASSSDRVIERGMRVTSDSEDTLSTMSRGQYSHCPLKKRPVHILKDLDDTKGMYVSYLLL